MSVAVASFYRFASLPSPTAWRDDLEALARRLDLKGSCLVAPEGVNATLAGSRQAVQQFIEHIETQPGFAALSVRWTAHSSVPFRRLKVQLRREIVTLGLAELAPSTADQIQTASLRVKPEDWDALLRLPHLRIDVRNAFEVRIGSFKGAIDPKLACFRDFPRWAEQNLDLAQKSTQPVALFCTGGIRCEKAAAYLHQRGVETIYQLDGGILSYLSRTAATQWEGDCFLFDERVALNKQQQPSGHQICSVCRAPVAPAEQDHPDYQPGQSCPSCAGTRSAKTLARRRPLRAIRAAWPSPSQPNLTYPARRRPAEIAQAERTGQPLR